MTGVHNKVKKKLSAVEWNRRLAKSEYTERRLTFGLHTGKMLKEVPISYVKWAVLNLDQPWVDHFVKELQRRDRRFK